MKRVAALLLGVLMLLTGCTQQAAQNQAPGTGDSIEIEASSPSAPISELGDNTDEPVFPEDVQPEFTALNDPTLLQYLEDNIYADLVARFDREDYIIENISAIYVSEEYLEEVAYNAKSLK